MGRSRRQDFDADIDIAKSGLKLDESGNISSRIRGLGPSIAARNLKDEGVNVKQLIAGKDQGNLGSAEEEPLEKNKYAKGGKVGSASARADGCAERGKTKGTMIKMT